MIDGILPMLADLMGPHVVLCACEITDSDDLYPSESVAIANAVPKRRAEFAAGRRAARQALADIGHGGADLPVGPDRAPVWPHGTTGSITHDGGWALAAVADTARVTSVGIDLTEAAPLPEGVREQVLRHEEEAALDELSARAVFSAKETIYKTLAPSVGQVFGFAAAVVCPDLERGTFEARLVHPLGPYAAGASWQGVLVVQGGRLVTGLRMLAPPSAHVG